MAVEVEIARTCENTGNLRSQAVLPHFTRETHTQRDGTHTHLEGVPRDFPPSLFLIVPPPNPTPVHLITVPVLVLVWHLEIKDEENAKSLLRKEAGASGRFLSLGVDEWGCLTGERDTESRQPSSGTRFDSGLFLAAVSPNWRPNKSFTGTSVHAYVFPQTGRLPTVAWLYQKKWKNEKCPKNKTWARTNSDHEIAKEYFGGFFF